MKIDFEILTVVYKLVNVAGVNSVIDGTVYNGDKPIKSKSQDITMNLLTNVNSNRGLIQTGSLNINCWCKEREDGVADNSKMIEISSAIFTALGMDNDEIQTEQLTLKKESVKTFRDNVQDDMFYTNIRLSFTQKN